MLITESLACVLTDEIEAARLRDEELPQGLRIEACRWVDRPTTGCTTMAEEDLVRMIKWLRAPEHPCYALLTAGDYSAKWRAWNLPPPDLVGLH